MLRLTFPSMMETLLVKFVVNNFEVHDESISKLISNDFSLETGISLISNDSNEAKCWMDKSVDLLNTVTLQSNPLYNLSWPLPSSISIASP